MLASPSASRTIRGVPGKKFSRQIENMIAEIRGVPPDEGHSRPRETRSVTELVDHLLHKHRIGMKTPHDAIRDAWPEIVGEANLDYCAPLRIDRDRVLVVGVSNPVVRQELLFQKATVLARVRAIPACAQIEDVVFRTG